MKDALLDSDVLIDVLRGHPPAAAWIRSLPTLPPASGFAALELTYGARTARELADVYWFLRAFPLLWPSETHLRRALAEYPPLHLSHGLDLLDALTAATATAHGLAIATFNVRHFEAISGLQVVQPYVR